MAMRPRSGRVRRAMVWWLGLALAGAACGPPAAPAAERPSAPAPVAAAAASPAAPAPPRPLEPLKVAVRMALQQEGIDPDAVSYVAVGVGPQRLGAMEAGSVAAVVLSVADATQAREAGIGGLRLSDIKHDVRMSWMGAATSDREL